MKHNHDKRFTCCPPKTCCRPLPRHLVKRTLPRHWQKIIKNNKKFLLTAGLCFL